MNTKEKKTDTKKAGELYFKLGQLKVLVADTEDGEKLVDEVIRTLMELKVLPF